MTYNVSYSGSWSPAIAIVASLALAMETKSLRQEWAAAKPVEELRDLVRQKLDYFETSRPTAVNLRNACNDIKKLIADHSDCDQILNGIVEFAENLMRDDFANCRRMGEHGAEAILKQRCGKKMCDVRSF